MNFRNLAELSANALLVVKRGRIAYANPSAQRLFAQTDDGPALEGIEAGALGLAEALGAIPPSGVVAPLVTDARRLDGTPIQVVVHAATTTGAEVAISVQAHGVERRESWFRAAMDQSPDVIILIDRQTLTRLDCNETAARIARMSREDFLRSPYPTLVKLSRDQLASQFDQVIAQWPKPQITEIRIQRPDGSHYPAEATRTALKLEGRWVIVENIRDISERYAALAAAERFRAAVDASGDGLVLVDPFDRAVVDANDVAGEFLGRSRECLVGAPFSQLDPANRTSEELGREFDSVIEMHPDVDAAEFPARHAGDGRELWIERRRRAFVSQREWLILESYRDISERKRQQARIERLATVVNLSADIILLVDRQSMRYIDVNEAACRHYGYSRAELLDLSPAKTTLTYKSEEELAARFDEVIAMSPQVVRKELLEVRADGSTFEAEVLGQAILSEGRWVIVSTERDITDRRRAEEEIRRRVAELTRSNEELEQFAYVTSHDLSEPLRMVASYTQLLARRYADKFDDEGREFMDFVIGGAQRMKQLIDDLLAYSRAGRPKAQMKLSRLDGALDDALANLERAVRDSGARIDRMPLPAIVCERVGMVQLFQNLVGNALKFRGGASPVVRIQVAERGDEWMLSVADNGIGIAPEHFQRIFLIFQRLHGRADYDGTGIGLAICKKIVERHGGRIWVESPPGAGTIFKFTLSKSLRAES